jgi:DNA-binding XRE family transcriptional regulator
MSHDQPTFVLREAVNCPHCGLREYLTETGRCVRCARPLGVEYLRLDVAAQLSGNIDRTLSSRIGAHIKAIRAQRQISQQTLARATGVSRTHLSRIENGSICPSLPTLMRVLCGRALGLKAIILRFDQAQPTSTSQRGIYS